MDKLTPKKAVMSFCRECVQGNYRPESIRDCQGDQAINGACLFYPYRLGEKRISVKVFRKFCLECNCGSEIAVRECESEDCFCHPYRMGKNPARKETRNVKSLPVSGEIDA